MENAFTSFIFEFENSLLEFFIRLFVEIFHPVSLLGILLTAHVLQLQLQSRSLRLQVYHLKSTSNCLTLFSIQQYLSCTGTCTCTCGVGTCTVLVPEVLVLVVSVLVLVLVPEVLVLLLVVLVLIQSTGSCILVTSVGLLVLVAVLLVLVLVLVSLVQCTCTYIKGTGTSTGTCVVGTCIGTVLVLYSCDVGICTRATGTDTCT